MSRQPVEQLIARMLRLLDDLDNSGIHMHGVINFAKPQFTFTWIEDGEQQHRNIYRDRDTDVWTVTR